MKPGTLLLWSFVLQGAVAFAGTAGGIKVEVEDGYPAPPAVCVGEETEVWFSQRFDWDDPVVRAEVNRRTSVVKQEIILACGKDAADGGRISRVRFFREDFVSDVVWNGFRISFLDNRRKVKIEQLDYQPMGRFIREVGLWGSFGTAGAKKVTASSKALVKTPDVGGPFTFTGSAEAEVTVVKVEFDNNTRNHDRVVSARNPELGLPGGIKKLDVKVTPATTTTVNLRIRRTKGRSGSAVFQDTGRAWQTITGTQTVTVLGWNVSSEPRDMAIEASVRRKVCATWEFTVFLVEPGAYIGGNVSAVLPASAVNPNGASLRALDLASTGGREPLGHNHIRNTLACGGIVIRGKIVPSGMAAVDFNRDHSRTEAFNWDRRSPSSRVYDKSNCLHPVIVTVSPDFICEDCSDDLSDADEDLRPDRDGSADQLFIWVIDAPNSKPVLTPNEGDITRIRYQFAEHARYAGVRVSEDMPWYWCSSQENPPGADTFVQNDDYTRRGDNRLGVGTTRLTPDLWWSVIPNFTVTGSTPATIKQGQTLAGTVDGRRLDSGAPCQRMVYMIREEFSATGGNREVVRLENISVTRTRIAGTYRVPAAALLGDYLVKVFISDKARTSPDATTVIPP